MTMSVNNVGRMILSNRSQVGDKVQYTHRHGQRRFTHIGEVISLEERPGNMVGITVKCVWSVKPGESCVGQEHVIEIRRRPA